MGYDWKGCKLTAVVSSLYALSNDSTSDPKENVHVFGTETRTS